jgi:hypothetical protein
MKRVPNAMSGGYDNYLLRDIPMDGSSVYKVLVRESVQPGGLVYKAELSILTFDKVARDVTHTPTPVGDVVAQQIVSDILVTYDAERGALNSHAVRELIRKMLLDRKAVNVRGEGGGLYFVGRDEQEFFEHLEGFAAMLPGKVEMGSHPVLDDAKRREMLQRPFMTEVTDETDRIAIELSVILENKTPISSARMASYLKQMEDAKEKVAEYDKLLETTHDLAYSALSIVNRQLGRLLPLVKL